MIECPLARGNYYRPKDGDRVAFYPQPIAYTEFDPIKLDQKICLRILRNMSDKSLPPKTKLKINGVLGVPVGDDAVFDATVDDYYTVHIPPGAWFRARVKSEVEIINDKLNKIIELLTNK